MKVLFITHNVPRFAGDAAGSFVLRLAVALRDAGVRVDIIAPGAPTLESVDEIEGIQIRRVRYASDSNMTLAYTGTMAETVRASWAGRFALFGLIRFMRRALRQQLRNAAREGQPYDIVHAHWWFPAGLIARMSGVGARNSIALVVTMHGSDVRLAQGTKLSHGFMRSVLQRASGVTAVSNWLATRASAIVPSVAVHVSPMPVDTALFAPPSDTADATRAGVLFVGRLNAQKGLADLLDAFAAIPENDAKLNVVGDGPDAGALRARADKLGIASRVKWFGALTQRDVVPLYQAARCVAIPSREEGLGLVAVEAQLCATPVVAYNSGGLPDVVRPEHGGTLVEPGQIDALTFVLSRFLGASDQSRNAARESGVRARANMLDQFSPQTVAQRYLKLYDIAATGDKQ